MGIPGPVTYANALLRQTSRRSQGRRANGGERGPSQSFPLPSKIKFRGWPSVPLKIHEYGRPNQGLLRPTPMLAFKSRKPADVLIDKLSRFPGPTICHSHRLSQTSCRIFSVNVKSSTSRDTTKKDPEPDLILAHPTWRDCQVFSLR